MEDEHKRSKSHKEHKEHANSESKSCCSTYKTATWILAVLCVILLIAVIRTSNTPTSGTTGVSQDVIQTKTLTFVTKLLQGQGDATIGNITDQGSVYGVQIIVGGRPLDAYVSKDGVYLFPNGLDMTKELPKPPEPVKTEIIKADKPTVQVFVMSECPYGVMAEDAMIPAIKTFGKSVNFEIRFIANEDGKGGFDSLHGAKEVEEDLRQVCAKKQYPDTYLDYIDCQNKNYLDRKDMGTTWNECLKKSKMDEKKITTCVTGEEGKSLLKENIKLANDKGIGSSPTILINDANYQGGRTAAEFQSAICNAFNTAPESCANAINVTSTATAPPGGCITP